MKKLLFISLLFATTATSAQKKDSTLPKKDSIIQPTTETPLLTASDVRFLHDSVAHDIPYSYAPALDQLFNWLNDRVRLRALEFINKQRKRP